MKAKSLFRLGLIVLATSVFPASLAAQTVDDTGSKYRLEQAVREEAKQFRISARALEQVERKLSIQKQIETLHLKEHK